MSVAVSCSETLNVRYTGKSDVFTFFDSLGREIRKSHTGRYGLSGIKEIISTTEYDSLGRVSRVSDPHFIDESNQAGFTSTTYDALNRPISVTSPDGSVINYTYNGLTTSTQFVPADGIGTYTTNTIEKNALGQKVKTSTNGTNEVQFTYDPFGNLVRTTDPDFNTVEMGYDIRGRKTKMDDPDQGEWTYTYYADGALRSQKDANTKTVVNYYDKLGRMTSRVQPERTSNWSYDTCTMGTGKLCSVTDNSGFTEIYTYNNLGLPHTTTTKISGQSDMVHSYTYDDKSRIETVTYPAGFKIKNHYNSLGFKEKVTDDKLSYSRGYVLWEAKEINAKGQVELFKQGSLTTTRRYNDLTGRLESQEVHRVGDEISSQTYKWLSNGNLDWKTDRWKGRTSEEITDYYGYDSLNRLTSTQTIVGSQQRSYVTLDYDALGNITYKSDVGTYTYTGSGGPHAVSSITGKGSYTYDANGNMRTGDGREIFYTSFNKPNKIKQNGNTTYITYGPDRKRYKRVDANKSTIYYAGAYEKEIRNGATIHRVNIGDFAMMEIKSGVKYTFLNIRDHLGSLIGTVKNTNHHDKRYSFDPWGKRRTAGISYEMLQLDYTSMINAVTQRGFTGHEHLSNVGLIHMNGRVYDPEIARFLSADPLIQAPNNLQSYNRYSYTINNPLRFIDPSGYSWLSKKWKKIRGAIKVIAAVAIAVYAPQLIGKIAGFLKGFMTAKSATSIATSSVASVVGALGESGENDINGKPSTQGVGGNIGFQTNFDPAYNAAYKNRDSRRYAFVGGHADHNNVLADPVNIGPALRLYNGMVVVRKYGSPKARLSKQEITTVTDSLYDIFNMGGVNGRNLHDRIMSGRKPTTVILNDLGQNEAIINARYLTVDFNTSLVFRDYNTGEKRNVSSERLLAHEMGHAVMGLQEEGFLNILPGPKYDSYPTVEFTDGIMSGINNTKRAVYSNMQSGSL